jgi:hypothetical protein
MDAMKELNYRSMLNAVKEFKSHFEQALFDLSEADEPLEAKMDAIDQMEEQRSMIDGAVAQLLKARIYAGIGIEELRELANILSLDRERGFTKTCCVVRAKIARVEKSNVIFLGNYVAHARHNK